MTTNQSEAFGPCERAHRRDPVRVCKRQGGDTCPPCRSAHDDDEDYETATYGGESRG